MMWRLPSISELTQILHNTRLTHLDSEDSIYLSYNSLQERFWESHEFMLIYQLPLFEEYIF